MIVNCAPRFRRGSVDAIFLGIENRPCDGDPRRWTSLPWHLAMMNHKQLGRIKREFKPGRTNFVVGTTIGGLWIALGCVALGLLIESVIDSGGAPPKIGRNVGTWIPFGICVFLGAMALGAGVFAVFWCRKMSTYCVAIGEYGFARSDKSGVRVVLWDDIESICENAPGNCLIVSFGGDDRITFAESFIHPLDKLARVIKKEIELRGRKLEVQEDRHSDFDSIKSEIDRILELDFATDDAREEHNNYVYDVLLRLDAELNRICQQAGGYPANAIRGDVWLDGWGYANHACALTHHFRKAGWLAREENASALWAKATLAVCSHYRHMVGPSMLANADCHRRLGNFDRATEMYTMVVKDFAYLARKWMETTDGPVDTDRVEVESLQTAIQRLLSRGIDRVDEFDLRLIRKQVDEVLARPVQY